MWPCFYVCLHFFFSFFFRCFCWLMACFDVLIISVRTQYNKFHGFVGRHQHHSARCDEAYPRDSTRHEAADSSPEPYISAGISEMSRFLQLKLCLNHIERGRHKCCARTSSESGCCKSGSKFIFLSTDSEEFLCPFVHDPVRHAVWQIHCNCNRQRRIKS